MDGNVLGSGNHAAAFRRPRQCPQSSGQEFRACQRSTVNQAMPDKRHSREALRDRFLAPIIGAGRIVAEHVAPAPGGHDDPTISPYASCCSLVRPFSSGWPSETWTWAVISLAAGVRVAAGERHGKRNPDSTARRCLLAAHGCSRVSSSVAWRRKPHWRKQPRRPRHASLIPKKSRMGLASRRHPARQSRNPEQSCGSLRCRSRRRKLPFKCRSHGNRAPRPRSDQGFSQGFTRTTARLAGRSGEEDRPEDLAE